MVRSTLDELAGAANVGGEDAITAAQREKGSPLSPGKELLWPGGRRASHAAAGSAICARQGRTEEGSSVVATWGHRRRLGTHRDGAGIWLCGGRSVLV